MPIRLRDLPHGNRTLGHMWMDNLTIQYYSMQMPRVIPDQVSEKVIWVMVWNAF